MEEVIQEAFPRINLSHSPPTPGRSAPVSKRPNRATAAAASVILITTGNSGHIKKCKTDQEKLARKNQK